MGWDDRAKVHSKSWWRRALDLTLWNQIERAEAEIAVREQRVKALKENRPALKDPRAVEALAVIDGLLEYARTSAAGNNQQGAWNALDDIDEELVWTMTRDEAVVYGGEVAARFNKAHAGSAGEYAAALVAGEALEGLDDTAVRVRVRKAAEMRHQHWEYKYHAAGMMVGHVALLAAGLALALAAFLVLAGKRSAGLLPAPLDQPPFVLAIVLLGMIGGTASAILTATAGDRILPDTAKAAPWFLARPLFGAAAALLVTALLAGGALGVSVDQRSAYLAWAAAAGFSEALLTKLATKMSSKADDDAKS